MRIVKSGKVSEVEEVRLVFPNPGSKNEEESVAYGILLLKVLLFIFFMQH